MQMWTSVGLAFGIYLDNMWTQCSSSQHLESRGRIVFHDGVITWLLEAQSWTTTNSAQTETTMHYTPIHTASHHITSQRPTVDEDQHCRAMKIISFTTIHYWRNTMYLTFLSSPFTLLYSTNSQRIRVHITIPRRLTPTVSRSVSVPDTFLPREWNLNSSETWGFPRNTTMVVERRLNKYPVNSY